MLVQILIAAATVAGQALDLVGEGFFLLLARLLA
jgi:hypothetical protein